MTYPPLPDYLETEPRYTTVPLVKAAMGIMEANLDDVIKQSIVAIESLIDSHMGTSYPQDPDPDGELDPAPIEGIPVQIQKAAKLGAIALVKLDDTPFGTAGSDEFFGVIEPETAGRAFNSVKPLLLGLRRSWGIS